MEIGFCVEAKQRKPPSATFVSHPLGSQEAYAIEKSNFSSREAAGPFAEKIFVVVFTPPKMGFMEAWATKGLGFTRSSLWLHGRSYHFDPFCL